MSTLIAAEETRKKEAAEKEEAEQKKKEQEEKEREQKETERKRKANVAKNRRKEPVVQPAGIRANPTASSSKWKTDEVSDMTDSELSRKKKKNGDSEVDEGKIGDRCNECRGKSEECWWPTDGRRKTCLGCSRRKTVCVVDGIQVSGYKSRAAKSKAEVTETVDYEEKVPLRRMQKICKSFLFFCLNNH